MLFSTVFAIELWNFHKLSDSGKNEFLPKKIGDSVTNFHSIANFTGLPGLYATAISSYSFWATWLKLHIYVPRHTVKIFYWGFFDILPVSIFIPNYNIYIEKSKKIAIFQNFYNKKNCYRQNIKKPSIKYLHNISRNINVKFEPCSSKTVGGDGCSVMQGVVLR